MALIKIVWLARLCQTNWFIYTDIVKFCVLGYALIGNAFDEVGIYYSYVIIRILWLYDLLHLYIDLSKNEQLAKVNPLKTIPSIDDNGFCLCER